MMNDFKIENFSLFESFCIEASAGTGKTYSIMQIVKKLIESGVPLDKILLVTYTEKAVGELKDRIQKELLASVGDPYKEEFRDKYRKALSAVNNAPIFTIHSFCKETLMNASFFAGTPASLDIIAEASVTDMLDEKLRDEFQKEIAFGNEPEQNVTELLKDYSGFNDILRSAADKYYLDRKGKEDDSIVSYNVNEKEYLSSGKKFIAGKLRYVYTAWQLRKQEEKRQSFNDMIRSVRESVCGENPGLREYLRAKYTYAVIDEFQDTNQKQWDIFRTVFFRDEEGRVKEHALIVVGDPKQSIYAFQGAELRVYLNAVNEIGKCYRISVNHRSTDNIIKACNELVGGADKENRKFFAEEEPSFSDSQCPARKKTKPGDDISKADAEFDGSITKPVWLLKNTEEDETVDEFQFAKFAVGKIRECCERGEKGKTRLQIFAEDKVRRRNVTYADFAVLCRTRSELPPMIRELKKAGIPFIKYKDKGLFNGKECYDWYALLSAIVSDDFAGNKRKILNAALFTDFFDVPLEHIGDCSYDNPESSVERGLLSKWRGYADGKHWFAMIESIFADTKIEKRLSEAYEFDKLFKYRQIGFVVLDYLMASNRNLQNCMDYLRQLSRGESSDEDDENYVELGTNRDCVKVMTIHASKGLEFPVVISVAGFKGKNNKVPHCWQAYSDGKLKLGFDNATDADIENRLRKSFRESKGIKSIKKAEDKEAFKGYYEENKIDSLHELSDKNLKSEFRRLFYVAYTRATSLLILPYCDYAGKNNTKGFEFLKTAIDSIAYGPTGGDSQFCQVFYAADKNIVSKQESVDDGSSEKNSFVNEDIPAVRDRASDMMMHKYSYSTLRSQFAESMPDGKAVVMQGNYKLSEAFGNKISHRGAYFGNAVHEILEKIDFRDFADFDENRKALLRNVSAGLGGYGINDCAEEVLFMFKNTLSAVLPGCQTKFTDISLNSRISEGEFIFAFDEENEILRKYCGGFVDLMFRTGESKGNQVFTLVDWKTDYLDENDYASVDKLKEKVDADYSVQRVLYSYCLVKWLRIFYPAENEDEIIKKHFGGIHYVFVRGTQPGLSNGIYGQKWASWKDLKAAFETIKAEC